MQNPCWHFLQAGSSFLFLVLTFAPSLSSLKFLIGPVTVWPADDDCDQSFYTDCRNGQIHCRLSANIPLLTPISVKAKPRLQLRLLLPRCGWRDQSISKMDFGVLDLKAPILRRHPAFLSNGDQTSEICLKSMFNIQLLGNTAAAACYQLASDQGAYLFN